MAAGSAVIVEAGGQMRSAGTHFGEVRAEDRAMIQAAARRSGLSVSEWLDTVITSAANQTEQPPVSGTEQGSKTLGEPEVTTIALHKRIDHLAGQLEQLLQLNCRCAESPSHADGTIQLSRLEDAINRLCDRLNSVALEVPAVSTYYDPPVRPGLFSRLIAARN